MALDVYKKKRDFKKTPEPEGKVERSKKSLMFVVQKHDASHLHYDFRLEMEGVLKSWAVPKGPSLDTKVNRLAMQVEDHPYSYRNFEGVIPEGEYGGGEVIVWDTGVYSASGGEKALLAGFAKGKLTFVMLGKKLKGEFTLIRTRVDNEGRAQWILRKDKDEYASEKDITEDISSVLSDKVLSRDGGSSFGTSSKAKKYKGVAKPLRKSLAPPITKKATKKGSAKVRPEDLKPMLATLTDAPFDDENWVYEIKWDGFRLVAHLDKGSVTLYSRNQIDVTKKYPTIARALEPIAKAYDAVIDGELVALDAKGQPKFQLMQQSGSGAAALVYYIFDLLFLDGEDVREKTLLERKELLASILDTKKKNGDVRLSEHITEKGTQFFETAKKQGLEGVMAKRSDSTYRSDSRSDDWLKIKVEKRQEAVVIGYTDPRGGRKGFGALILAVREGDAWRYVGHTGTGFGTKGLAELYKKMQPLVRKSSVVKEKIPVNEKPTWLTPKLICEIKFTEWTADGHMRHPVYMGLRTDKAPEEVTLEKEIPVEAELKKSETQSAKAGDEKSLVSDTKYRTNLDKMYWPKDGFTKGDLLDYYERMAEYILPYLKDRPFVLNRHPGGIDKQSFYQKDVDPASLPDYVRTVPVFSESNDKELNFIVCDNKETLLYLANLGCIEMNPWNSRVQSIRNPDWYVIDLDPGENSFDQVIEVALVARQVLDMSCERCYVKTSGKTGLHIYIPLAARYDYDQVRQFAEVVVRLIHQRIPDITSLERSPAKRKDKIYLDWLQNRFGQTLAAPYSVRPFPGATVSTPLEWNEVEKGLTPSRFTIETIGKRITDNGDLFTPVMGEGVKLEDAIVCLQKEMEPTEKKPVAKKAATKKKGK